VDERLLCGRTLPVCSPPRPRTKSDRVEPSGAPFRRRLILRVPVVRQHHAVTSTACRCRLPARLSTWDAGIVRRGIPRCGLGDGDRVSAGAALAPTERRGGITVHCTRGSACLRRPACEATLPANGTVMSSAASPKLSAPTTTASGVTGFSYGPTRRGSTASSASAGALSQRRPWDGRDEEPVTMHVLILPLGLRQAEAMRVHLRGALNRATNVCR